MGGAEKKERYALLEDWKTTGKSERGAHTVEREEYKKKEQGGRERPDQGAVEADRRKDSLTAYVDWCT